MFPDTWFWPFLKSPRKHEADSVKETIGVLGFEVTSLMSKLVCLWKTLTDKQILRLREDIIASVGIKRLISEDEEFTIGLMGRELMEIMEHVAKAVARLSKKCSDSGLRSFELLFNELMRISADPHGWELGLKKMEKQLKKMEYFVSVNATLYQEMENLVDLEQSFRRIKLADAEVVILRDFQKRVIRKQQEVKRLCEISLWNRTYDYTVLMLARSLFTIFSRIRNVFGINQTEGSADFEVMEADFISRSHSVSGLIQTSVHISEPVLPVYSSDPRGSFISKSGPILIRNNKSNFHSGPLVGLTPKQGLINEKKKKLSFSGPLGMSATKSGPPFGHEKTSKSIWKNIDSSTIFFWKKSHSKTNRLTQVGPFKGQVIGQNGSLATNFHSGILNTARSSSVEWLLQSTDVIDNKSISSSRKRLLDAPPDTLGAAALALHYANVIILIEKLATSSHLVGNDVRDDLYGRLPASVRTSLRQKLKPYMKNLASSVYDQGLAEEWHDAMTTILEWLAPLAHNMIRWQSERSYEQQNVDQRTKVLLVQTLYFANQEKTEAAITELLVGLNFICRHSREMTARALQQCDSNRDFDER